MEGFKRLDFQKPILLALINRLTCTCQHLFDYSAFAPLVYTVCTVLRTDVYVNFWILVASPSAYMQA